MTMDKERKQDIALMRYSAIAPLITGMKEDYPSLKAFFCQRGHRPGWNIKTLCTCYD